ncbi:hypothetical protein AGLY_017616 [Aphis glycines]|uniref:Uncharacterized protein n=1 Tax=Aphis glycines TaxID=307491 RepID=A0A6G0SUE4_APHGL|nr:hypothetical protein AGLY_017616 [Aphis glycines]
MRKMYMRTGRSERLKCRTHNYFLSLHCNLSEHIYIDLLLAHDHNQLYDQFHLVLHNLTRSTPLGVMSTISPVEELKLADGSMKNKNFNSDNNKRPRHYKIDETFDLYVTMFEMLTEKQNDYTLKFLSLHCNLSEHIYIDLLLAHDHNQLYDQFHLVLHNLTRSTPLGVMSTISPVEELKLADGSMKNKNFNVRIQKKKMALLIYVIINIE